MFSFILSSQQENQMKCLCLLHWRCVNFLLNFIISCINNTIKDEDFKQENQALRSRLMNIVDDLWSYFILVNMEKKLVMSLLNFCYLFI